MIKLVCIDLDGTLCSTKELHRSSLAMALSEMNIIIDHTEYEALPTRQKLKMMCQKGIIEEKNIQRLYDRKQEITLELFKTGDFYLPYVDLALSKLFHEHTLACCSNTIRSTLDGILKNTGYNKYFSRTFSNEDVVKCKPDPEMYLKAMWGFKPDETLIIEDSPVGLEAAYATGARVMKVDSPKDFYWNNICRNLT